VTRFLLLRHAAHDLAGKALAGRMPGLGLNALGRRQAQEIAEPLHRWSVAAIYCSPQQRTRETITPTAALLGLPIEVAPEFDEVDFGTWTGQSFADVAASHPAHWHQWVHGRAGATPPGGEAFSQVPRRTMAGLARLQRLHPQGTMLIVSHGDVIKATVATQLGLSLDLLERFEIACASLTVIDMDERGSLVKLVNGSLL
jgi:broad specificity phosphatase PhoE